MFVPTPNGQLIAYEAKTGNILWRYRKPRTQGSVVLHDNPRGVALFEDKVFFASVEAELVAIDAKTGRAAWTTNVGDNKSGYYTSMAPIVADGKVMVGVSGGETGVRGYVVAVDARTGKEAWRTYTTAAPGDQASSTTPVVTPTRPSRVVRDSPTRPTSRLTTRRRVSPSVWSMWLRVHTSVARPSAPART